jgi:hypothetical protein
MKRRDLETAAANYSYLRGLLLIPLGMLFILGALGNGGVGPLRHEWAFLVAVGALGACCWLIYRYYNEHYGRLSSTMRENIQGAVAVAAGLVVVFGGSTLLRSESDWSLDLPVNAAALTFAVVMLIVYGVGIGWKAHHVIVWGTLFVAGALPVWNGADPSNIGMVLSGVALMICGVFDHRLFVETFGPPKALDREERDVGA